jgi:hypothetical protein
VSKDAGPLFLRLGTGSFLRVFIRVKTARQRSAFCLQIGQADLSIGAARNNLPLKAIGLSLWPVNIFWASVHFVSPLLLRLGIALA